MLKLILPGKKGAKTKPKWLSFTYELSPYTELDHNEINQYLQVSLGEPTPFLGAKVEEIDTALSSTKEVVVVDATLILP